MTEKEQQQYDCSMQFFKVNRIEILSKCTFVFHLQSLCYVVKHSCYDTSIAQDVTWLPILGVVVCLKKLKQKMK